MANSAKPPKSKHKLDGEITIILPGIAIYKTHASPYYQARVRFQKTYKVRSTKETSKIKARQAAIEYAQQLHSLAPVIPTQFLFKSYALRWIEQARYLADTGARNSQYYRNERSTLERDGWGLLAYFADKDIRHIGTLHYIEYRKALLKKNPDLSPSTLNTIQSTFRNVMKLARDEGVIDAVPDTPRTKVKDNPRAFFRFYPLVERADDEYKLLRKTALAMARDNVVVRGVPVTQELYDLILFAVHSFLRPTHTELYALRHRDIVIGGDPKRLIMTVKKGKTGHRVANSMPGAVSAYRRILDRQPNRMPDDYLFFPGYQNRSTAVRVGANQFNEVLKRSNLKIDPVTGAARSVYSLRHTAICLRLIKSEGQVNIYNLAKNAGTSVEQIERFYAKNLPLSPELARNLQIMPQPQRRS